MEDKKPMIKNGYFVFIFVMTFFMSIVYARISDINHDVNAIAEADMQEGVYITDVTYLSNNKSDEANSKINYTLGTMMDSQIVLGNEVDSSITYQVDLYNNSNKDYLFIGVLTDYTNPNLYSNENIEFAINGMQEYVTTILAKQSLSFTITFKYIDSDNIDLTLNTLLSKLNFRFQEIPKMKVSSEGQTLLVNNIYPDYTPYEYTFSVSNYDELDTNNVPMTYYFETNVDSPLTIKVYDEVGNEVTDGISMVGDGEQLVDHIYTLKIFWDNSNPEDGIEYNSADYAGKDFNCKVIVRAIPVSDKYMTYTLIKEFNISITSASLNFVANPVIVKVEKTESPFTLTINNNVSSMDYNVFSTSYEITLTDNTKFTLHNGGVKILSGGSALSDNLNLSLLADINNLNVTENANLNISITSPYVKEITVPLTISLQAVTVSFDANGGSVSPTSIIVYKGKNYTSLPIPTWKGHTFNGWFTAASGGTKIENTTEVTTSSSQKLYAQWTSRLLADYVLAEKANSGDYVEYPVEYTNVYTNSSSTHIAESTYVGWRILDVVEPTNGDSYVRLISAGVPMTYQHPKTTTDATAGETSVTNLTTQFFNTPINSTRTDYNFYWNGFTGVSTIADLKAKFTNKYTQISGTTPKVQSITNADVEKVLNLTVVNVTDVRNYDLFAIPSEDQTGAYAGYYLATAEQNYYLWASYYSGYIVYTFNIQGVRPVVSLKSDVEVNGQVDGVWQLAIEE